MAGDDGRFFLCLLLTCRFLCSLSSDSVSLLQDLSSEVLQEHIKSSRHSPLCVVYKYLETDGVNLEQRLRTIWQDRSVNASYTNWLLGTFSFYKKTRFVERKPDQLPAMKCYIGEGSSFLYQGKYMKKRLHHWLQQLVTKHGEQLEEASSYLLNQAVKNYSIIIVAFPDYHRNYEIEEMVIQLSSKVSDCKAFIVHPYSLQSQDLQTEFKITSLPAVLVISKHGTKNKEPIQKIFLPTELESTWLKVYLSAVQIQAHHYTHTVDFKNHVLTFENETQYIPKFITFYGYWGRKFDVYLSAFRRSLEEFQELGVQLEFGLVNLAVNYGRDILSQHIESQYIKEIPFSILYFNDSNGNFKKIRFDDDRPTPLSLYSLLDMAGVNITDKDRKLFVQKSYGYEVTHEISSLFDGPFGTMCSVWSHNGTATPFKVKTEIKPQTKKKTKKQKDSKSWHEKFASESIDKKLQKIDGIPIISMAAWSEVIEKSHAPLHPFQGGQRWAGEVTKVAMVIFVKSDCGSCRNNMKTFKQLHQSVQYTEGGSLYLVNCSTDPVLCRTHNIKGFPYITAFRGLGWLDADHCASQESRRKYTDYVRLDYHGVILEKPIMEWFTYASGSSVINRKFDWPKVAEMKEDVRLLGVLMPKKSSYLPIPPNRNQNYYFSYKCFRLACERLHGKAVCNSVYSLAIPNREFGIEDLDIIVSEVILQRKDGVTVVVTELGSSLLSTLEKQSESNIHKFHRPHKYNLKDNQKCEHNHAECTDFILAFTLDHSRLPITHISSDAFHTVDRPSEKDLPVLIALVYKSNMTENSPFLHTLTEVAYELYNDIVVATFDVEQYPTWAGQFVPENYRNTLVEDDDDPERMYMFPRICFILKNDHKKAAFYPPRGQDLENTNWFTKERITTFAKSFLKNKDKYLERTLHF